MYVTQVQQLVHSLAGSLHPSLSSYGSSTLSRKVLVDDIRDSVVPVMVKPIAIE